METTQSFNQQIDALREQVRLLDHDFEDGVIDETASRLTGLNFSPPIITPVDIFLKLKKHSLLAEIDRILSMPDAEACALAPDNSQKCEDLRVQFITVLIFYYKKLLALREGDPEEWDEVDELYVHD